MMHFITPVRKIVKSSSTIHRSAFTIRIDTFPCPLIAFTESHATFVMNFVRDFLNISDVHIRGDPDARTAND